MTKFLIQFPDGSTAPVEPKDVFSEDKIWIDEVEGIPIAPPKISFLLYYIGGPFGRAPMNYRRYL